ncbi:MAG: phospholipase [Chloroflexi bacterium]|nr:phospholipase [Chloroflexota bacterium]
MSESSHTHHGQPVLATGAPLQSATAAMILIHGRGATAESILSLAAELSQPGFACLAPQAAANTWYPYSFLQPLEANEPHLSSALAVIAALVEHVNAAGVPTDKIVILGFSQGACLALEFAARNAQRFGGVIAFSGGLIGPDGISRDYAGSLAGTPVFIGCSDVDFHIPVQRVQHSTAILQQLGGEVTERIYPGMGHTVNEDEINFARALIAPLGAAE